MKKTPYYLIDETRERLVQHRHMPGLSPSKAGETDPAGFYRSAQLLETGTRQSRIRSFQALRLFITTARKVA
jgi:hypothetical protein